MCVCETLLEFRLPSLTGVLPADEANKVVDAGIGDGHHHHGMQFLLGRLHREVDVNLFGCSCTYVALIETRT